MGNISCFSLFFASVLFYTLFISLINAQDNQAEVAGCALEICEQGAKMAAESNNLDEVLRPFYQRASEAEDRLARLEASIAGKKDSGNEEQLKLVNELQSNLEKVKAEQLAEREKAVKGVERLTAENAKLQYRILHLVRALKEADSKLAAN